MTTGWLLTYTKLETS